MDLKVRFRFNTATGEVEVFDVIDDGPMRLPEAEHNREHDRAAAEIGNVLERNPRVDEILPGAEPLPTTPIAQPPDTETTPDTPEQKRRKQAQ